MAKWILGIAVVIVVIIIVAIPMITVSYEEPYTTTETYWTTETYYEREACERGCRWELVEPSTRTTRNFHNIDCTDDLQYFTITYHKDGVIYATREVYIPVGEIRTVDAGEYNFYCSISVDPLRRPKDCRLYVRDVQRTIEVVRLREASEKVTILKYLFR